MKRCAECPWGKAMNLPKGWAEKWRNAQHVIEMTVPHACHVRANNKVTPDDENEVCVGHKKHLKKKDNV